MRHAASGGIRVVPEPLETPRARIADAYSVFWQYGQEAASELSGA